MSVFREMSETEKLSRELRNIPHSCAHWDDAISHIEDARTINGDLREVAYRLVKRIEEIESDYADREDEIKGLRELLASKEDEIVRLKDEIAFGQEMYGGRV